MHGDGTSRESGSLEEVLRQAVSRQHRGVESLGPTCFESFEDYIEHRFGDADFPRFRLRVDQLDDTYLLRRCLGKERLKPADDETERNIVDEPQHHVVGGIGRDSSQRLFNRFGEAVCQRPHLVQSLHLLFEAPVEPDQIRDIPGLDKTNVNHLAERSRRWRRFTPHFVTSHIASATMAPLIFDVPNLRSRKMIGTSSILRPASAARIVISTWNP